MRRAGRAKPERPLPPLRDNLPRGKQPSTRRPQGERRKVWSQEDLYPQVMADAEWSVRFRRPQTTNDCPPGDFCPFVGCPFHLYLDVNPVTGVLILNHPTQEVWEMEECCVLKALEKKASTREDGYTLEQVGCMMGLTRERVRQIEQEVRRRARHDPALEGYRDMFEVDEV